MGRMQVDMTVNSIFEVRKVVEALINESRWFQVMPLPDDHYSVVVKGEDEKLLRSIILPDLTHEQKKNYLENANGCPFCLSSDIDAELVDVDAGSCSQKVWCLKCDRAWYDIYKLVDVEAKR